MDCPVYLPVEEYTANIGLALGLGTPKGLQTSASSPALTLGIRKQGYGSPRNSTRKLLSVGAAALALALLIPVSLVVMQTQSETELLTQELAVMDEHLRDLVKTKAPLENLELEVDRLREERREVLGAGGRFADRLDVVLGRLPESMAADSVKMTGDAIIMEGEAERFSQVIDFAAQMENAGLFSAVYLESLTSLGGSESGLGAAFRIRAEY
jgi:hypothetical protein